MERADLSLAQTLSHAVTVEAAVPPGLRTPGPPGCATTSSAILLTSIGPTYPPNMTRVVHVHAGGVRTFAVVAVGGEHAVEDGT